jgi:hypothetical protein
MFNRYECDSPTAIFLTAKCPMRASDISGMNEIVADPEDFRPRRAANPQLVIPEK